MSEMAHSSPVKHTCTRMAELTSEVSKDYCFLSTASRGRFSMVCVIESLNIRFRVYRWYHYCLSLPESAE
jgi:hypothetical protein